VAISPQLGSQIRQNVATSCVPVPLVPTSPATSSSPMSAAYEPGIGDSLL
jgi:hypothetical protein